MKLTKKQLSNLLSNVKDNGNDLKAKCPKCGKNEFGISLDDNHLFGCFRKKKCGFSGNIFILLKFLGIDIKTYSKKESVNVFQDKFSLFDEEDKKEFQLPETISLPLMYERVYFDEYCDSRHIQPYQYKKYNIGRSRLRKNYITMIVYMEGEVKAHLTRSKMPKEWHDIHPEYLRWNNSKTDFKKMLFGYDEIKEGITKTVILVEGFFDKTRTEDHLLLDEIDDTKCCATFGGHVTEDQVLLLKKKGVENIVLLFESDIISDIVNTLDKIGSKFESVKIGYLPKDRDPNELYQHQLLEVLCNLEDVVSFQLKYS